MTKQLTPPQALDEIIDDFIIVQDAMDIIDKSSQRDKDYFKQWLNERKNIIETALKALEIIKEKMVNVCAFISWNNLVDFTYEKYQELQLTYLISAKRLTKEEFDLLKLLSIN